MALASLTVAFLPPFKFQRKGSPKPWGILWEYSSFRAAMTKYQRQGGLNNGNLLLIILDAGRAPLLACRQLPSHCALTWPFPCLQYGDRESVYVPSSL